MFSNRKNNRDQADQPNVDKLYPDFTLEERAEAKETLHRYIELVWRIYQRISREKSEKFDGFPFKR
jgi:hypothetical protein